MFNKELRYLCYQYSVGNINGEEYRNNRERLLQWITYDEDSTLPVGFVESSSGSEVTAPINKNGLDDWRKNRF